MINIESEHGEFADDNTIWACGNNVKELEEKLTNDAVVDGEKIMSKWCSKWNMEITPEKTDTMLFSPAGVEKIDTKIKIKGQEINFTKSKKILGVIIDDDLNFEKHIMERKQKGFKALKAIEYITGGKIGCSQEIFMRLYKSLVLPITDYGESTMVTATDTAAIEFSKVQGAALLKATGFIGNTSLETLEVLGNCPPITLHMKLRQAEEMARIFSKHDVDPLKQDFDKSLDDRKVSGKKTSFNMLVSTFNEMKGKVFLENIAKEFKYSEDSLLISRKSQANCNCHANSAADATNMEIRKAFGIFLRNSGRLIVRN